MDILQPRLLHNNEKLEILSREMALCRRCVLAGYHAEAFPMFRGDALYPLTFIGQAPGNIERSRPLSFGGQAGRRLFQWLAQIGLSEEEARHFFYFSSMTKCFPGKAASGKGDRKPSPPEIALCQPFLQKELEIIHPRVIVPIGSMAITPIFGNLSLAKIIGIKQLFSFKDIASAYHFSAESPLFKLETDNVMVIPLPHPSGASRWLNTPANLELVQTALGLLQEELVSLLK